MDGEDPRGIEWSGISVTGPVRNENQDSIRCSGEQTSPGIGLLFALADGMGGYEHGKVASQTAIDELFNIFYSNSRPGKSLPAHRALQKGVESANLAVCNVANKLGAHRMGTTLTAAGIRGGKATLAHVGDSRAYLIRDHKATCLTSDHSVVGDLLRMRLIAPDQVRTHARRSVLTRALGLGLFVKVDIYETGLQEGDWLVLASDGVWSVVEDVEFASATSQDGRAEVVCQRLIDLALQKESDDNASVIAVYIRDLKTIQPEVARDRPWFSAFRRGANLNGRRE